ncbi:hypothetical protein [Rhizobium rhizogenes]|uniref:hypothetical protein n=1 Tax=Rhizobium rhizogenes TaxID=359 RepID=UPI00103A5FB2|nr:hypothetical protein [Rhizobium rhizogenes]NTG65142.1 hypothetical protein [Rhizobium rhizogenes]NTG71677.1 hypothetical protein [Rhizobium rhizogenes]NTG84492.1 hypothetical protein [Rhizobium rhizogenes]NTH29748.1 hypothetical protein [Rhizobium rhizogenes]NTI00345.1 hypothetical protein [Rhizobium rhizogenes]
MKIIPAFMMCGPPPSTKAALSSTQLCEHNLTKRLLTRHSLFVVLLSKACVLVITRQHGRQMLWRIFMKHTVCEDDGNAVRLFGIRPFIATAFAAATDETMR